MQGPRPILASASGNDADGSCGIGRVSSNDEEKHPTKKLLRKILIVGDLGCGKTSIIKRYTLDSFQPYYKSTIGVDFAMKAVNLNNNVTVKAQLWDISGQERFGSLTRVYYREANGAVIIFDSTRPDTLKSAQRWKKELDDKAMASNGRPVPTILLGNKFDLPKRGMICSPSRMNQFCNELGIQTWFETSAKTGYNVDLAMDTLLKYTTKKGSTSSLNNASSDVIPNEDVISVVSSNYNYDALEARYRCCT